MQLVKRSLSRIDVAKCKLLLMCRCPMSDIIIGLTLDDYIGDETPYATFCTFVI